MWLQLLAAKLLDRSSYTLTVHINYAALESDMRACLQQSPIDAYTRIKDSDRVGAPSAPSVHMTTSRKPTTFIASSL